ncbi:hypothetical protein BH09BAC2_BH09BAC2_00140 [soil metagenome]
MKIIAFILIAFLVVSCTDRTKPSSTERIRTDTAISIEKDSVIKKFSIDSNQIFKQVKAEQIGKHTFRITGKARVFEAAFSWYIEDGHNVLHEGHVMANAGAPEWGNFSFTVNAVKDMENSTLHIILYEASAKDGSMQHPLPVFLY